jgi:uncharacterized protein
MRQQSCEILAPRCARYVVPARGTSGRRHAIRMGSGEGGGQSQEARGFFPEATTVFGDPFEMTIPDPDHSDQEQRFLSLGLSAEHRVILVAYTERGNTIRIIHARTAAPKERGAYDAGKTT